MAELKMYGDTYIDDVYTSENTLYNSKLISPARLTKNLTFLYGRDGTTNIPLLSHTQGQVGGSKSMTPKELNDTQFTYPVMGRTKHTIKYVGSGMASAATKLGLGGTPFTLFFDSPAAHKYYTIYTPDKSKQLRVQYEPEKNAENKYAYTLMLMNGDKSTYILASTLISGESWVYGSTSIPLSMSDGTASNDRTPGKMKNQWGLHRYSKNIAGNVSNKVTVVEFPMKSGGTTKLWMPWSLQEWQLDMREAKEHDLWYTEYNRTPNGEITTIDSETGLPVPRGAGVKQQIFATGNHSTYSTLTLSKLNSTVHAVFGNRKGHMPMEIVMITGTGGAIQFHEAIKNDAVANQYYVALGESEIRSGGQYLEYGKYFRQYKTINGDTLTVVVSDFFNHGRFAEMDRANGNLDEFGYPMYSSTMVFLDQSINSDTGERNIQLIAEKGREHIAKVYPGMSALPPEWEAFSGNIVSTKKDIASFEIIDSDIIQIMNPTTSFWLDRVA